MALCGVGSCDRRGHSRRTEWGSLRLSIGWETYINAQAVKVRRICVSGKKSEEFGVSAKTCQHAENKSKRG